MSKKEKTYFNGTVVFGLNNSDPMNIVAVYRKGIVLNDTNFRPHNWLNGSGKNQVRNYLIGQSETMTKNEIASEMGISKLKSSQNGYRKFLNTKIGDVLVITYDTNRTNWTEANKLGFIDRAKKIHI
jgi:hypothetical protein